MYIAHTVSTLRDALGELPDDLPVYLSKDEEGNGFKRLYSVEETKYSESYGGPLDPDELEDDEVEDLINAVVLWP